MTIQKGLPLRIFLLHTAPNKVRAFLFLITIMGTTGAALGFSLYSPALVSADTNNTISFQAQLEQSNGTAVANGNYNVEFKLYNSASGGSALWTEDYLNSKNQGVNVASGYLTAQLGSITSFPSNINWSQNLWVTMNIGGTGSSPSWDGEMNPRLQLTAVPYAFQANQLEQSTGSNTSNLNWSPQTASNNILLPDESGTLCVDNDALGCGFAPGTSNSYIQNGSSPQSGASFNIGGSGTINGNLYLGSGSSVVGSSGLSIATSSGDLSLSTSSGGSLSLNSSGNLTLSSSNGSISLGSNNFNGALNLESSDINIGLSSPSSSNVINIGTGSTSVAGGQTINIGTGTPTGSGSNNIAIGNTYGGSSSTILGSALSLETGDYIATLNNSGLGLGTSSVNATADLTFGNGANRTINTLQSDSGDGTNVSIEAGQGASSGGNGGDLVLQAGAAGNASSDSGSVIARANGTDSSVDPAFAVQSANTTNLLAAYTGNDLVRIGIGTPTLSGTGEGDLYVTGSGEFGVELRVGNGVNGLNFVAGVAPSSTNPLYTGTSQPTQTVNEIPAYTGMTTSNNPNGDLSTGFDNSTIANTTTQNFRNYYNWTTTNSAAQTETLYVQIPVPRNFASLPQGDQICYNTYTDDTSGKSSITTTFYDTTNTAQQTFTATPTQANTWQQLCTTNIGGTITVNGSSYVTVAINLTAAPNQNVRIGNFSFDYQSAF
jgi:hypothetical protein